MLLAGFVLQSLKNFDRSHGPGARIVQGAETAYATQSTSFVIRLRELLQAAPCAVRIGKRRTSGEPGLGLSKICERAEGMKKCEKGGRELR